MTYKVNDELPVRTDAAAKPLAGMRADTCAWPALMEKTVASQDQSWDAKRYADWDHAWANQYKHTVDAERSAKGLPASPNDSPMGYDRLAIGSTAYDQADLLAELTGKSPKSAASQMSSMVTKRSSTNSGIVLPTASPSSSEPAKSYVVSRIPSPALYSSSAMHTK